MSAYDRSGYLRDTRRPARRVPCPPACALVCTVPRAWWMHVPPGPDPWHVAFAFVGLATWKGQHPLRPDEYPAAIELFAGLWGLPLVVDGIRKASTISAPHGSDVDPDRLAALADRLEREAAA